MAKSISQVSKLMLHILIGRSEFFNARIWLVEIIIWKSILVASDKLLGSSLRNGSPQSRSRMSSRNASVRRKYYKLSICNLSFHVTYELLFLIHCYTAYVIRYSLLHIIWLREKSHRYLTLDMIHMICHLTHDILVATNLKNFISNKRI